MARLNFGNFTGGSRIQVGGRNKFEFNAARGVWKKISSYEIVDTGSSSGGGSSETSITQSDLDALTLQDLSNVTVSVTPENLEINVDSPTAGHAPDWLWSWQKTTLPFARIEIQNQVQQSVPLYMEGNYVINNFAASLHGTMTQTHSMKLKWIEGPGDQNLVSWATYGTASKSVAHIDSGNTHTVQTITVSVPSSITLPTLTAPTVSYNVGAVAGAFVFSSTQVGNNPSIGPLRRGGTYTFILDGTVSGHPFYFTTDNGTNYSSGTYFGEYTNGVTGSRNDSGSVTFTIPANAPDTLYYKCGVHGSMGGSITIKDLAVETNDNGNYVIYAQHGQEGHKTPIEIRPLPNLASQMCIVYDADNNVWQPQDLATYVENTPSFENKIREVAGTATLVAPDGTSLVASVEVFNDATYLPVVGNVVGDLAYAKDTGALYIWENTEWTPAIAPGGGEAVPSALTDLGISDGTAGQALVTDGSGNFTFTDVATSANSLTDLGISDGTAGQALVTDGSGNFTFTDIATGANSLTDLGISDGTAGQALVTDGSGNFTFADVASGGGVTSYDQLTNKPTIPTSYNQLNDRPSIPSTLNDLGITDGNNGQFLRTDGNGNYSFINISQPNQLTDLGISDGSSGQILTTDGSGNFSFVNASAVAASATTTYANVYQLPTSGSTQGDLAYVESTRSLYIWSGSGWVDTTGPDSFWLIRAGNFTGPLTGVKTWQPSRTVQLTTFTAKLDSVSSTTSLVFEIMKNGTLLEQGIIGVGTSSVSGSFSANSIATTDVITMNIVSGTGNNLALNVNYI